jgi:hypothetical protein
MGLLARGACVGAALFGALVAALGGASPRLVGLFWGLGTLACLVLAWTRRLAATERQKKRRAG